MRKINVNLLNFIFFSEQSVKLVHEKNLHCELVASWKVSVGDQDQCLHLWRYTGGFASIDNARKVLGSDKVTANLPVAQIHILTLLAHSRISQHWRKSVAKCCAPGICNTNSPSATGLKSHPELETTCTKSVLTCSNRVL
jgi:hypothetical protein